jgi:predicted Zn-dependent protease
MLLDAVLGQQDAVEQILGQLAGLKFSRSHESEADEFSVRYLCGTSYNSDGAGGFFKKMANQPTPPEFLSTHPSPENRVAKMAEMESSLNCSGNQKNVSRYNQMKALLN